MFDQYFQQYGKCFNIIEIKLINFFKTKCVKNIFEDLCYISFLYKEKVFLCFKDLKKYFKILNITLLIHYCKLRMQYNRKIIYN